MNMIAYRMYSNYGKSLGNGGRSGGGDGGCGCVLLAAFFIMLVAMLCFAAFNEANQRQRQNDNTAPAVVTE